MPLAGTAHRALGSQCSHLSPPRNPLVPAAHGEGEPRRGHRRRLSQVETTVYRGPVGHESGGSLARCGGLPVLLAARRAGGRSPAVARWAMPRRPLSRCPGDARPPRRSRGLTVTQASLDARILALAAEGKGARLIARDLAGADFWGIWGASNVAARLRVLRATGSAR